jgi:hypothetical protein
MATDLQMSSSADVADYPYRALSRGAITSVILFLIACGGLLDPFKPLLALALLGVVVALLAIRSITKYPDEYSGLGLAKFALIANLLVLIGGVGIHTYTYLTEVPPGHVRAQFSILKNELQPNRPTAKAAELNGKDVFIKGYIHPSSGGGMLRRFVLVGDLGTCCFGGQPDSSEMIEVTLTGGQTVKGGLTRRKLAGEFKVTAVPLQQTDFDNAVFYRLKGRKLK